MKSIAIDFVNNTVCIMTEGQQGTQFQPDLRKEDFIKFIPDKKYMEFSSFTWNFEDETFTANQDYKLVPGAIMTQDCFIPELIIPYPGIKRKFKDFIKTLGMEEISTEDIFPSELKRFFGL